ncbi:helix-turn-helix transcriptional regulator [Bradyrhizobium sp. 33ap4]|uniref:helix-turn-helix domain-containing protein n=1 Tax=Bradyrhizobium sp. 33ap4 TaxID=3061630 RepID=UPI00292E20EC|nr:helix-turn-helix transcriptional regulator [Bradyrhizobium sp. 33ap4]
MARANRPHLPPSNKPPKSTLIPKQLTKDEFARRLYKLMMEKGWRQAEFARRAGLPRNAISVYLRAASLPSPENLKKIADALKIDPEVLLPNYAQSAIEQDNPELEMRVSPANPQKAWLRINRLVSTSIAVQILELLQKDDAGSDRS